MKISAITPTANRPVAFALLESMMARQTVRVDEWIVADGGELPTVCTMGQVRIHDPRPPGAANFAVNLLNGIALASGDIVVMIEDDDWLASTHIETLVAMFRLDILLAGDPKQRYYNVAHRCWKLFNNVGASLCQTAMRREALPLFKTAINDCLSRNVYGIDALLWRSVPKEQWALAENETVLGIKGLPGTAGLGIGHRPGRDWTADVDLRQLRAWIGDDFKRYAEFFRLEARAAA